MDQELALEIMLSGKNVFLTGAAGAGKTYVLNKFIQESRRRKKSVAITATTGLAASHLGGSTIHSWSGVGIHDELPSRFFDNLTKARREAVEKAEILIIDEISMLHDYRLDIVDEICKKVRRSKDPFGGLQVVFSGDFYQLPPVNRADAREGYFAVNAKSWLEAEPVYCYLSGQFRQEDDEYLEILNALRGGDLRRRHVEKLLSRKGADVGVVTELMTVNVDVDRINSRYLADIEDEERHFGMHHTGSENYVENLKRACLASEDLVLKKGALVMAIKNSKEKRFFNGSLGEVVEFDYDTGFPIVLFRNGREVMMEPDSWELRDGEKKRASLTQIPLRLAYAITIHKSQGMTLDGARVDLSRAFAPGMGYVALSRIKSLESLSLVGINKMALKVSDEAQELNEGFLRQSALAAKDYEHLRENAKKRTRKVSKNEASASEKSVAWKEKLAKMRETHPNAYMPWTAEDDNRLLKMFADNCTIKKMSVELGRHEGSIRKRVEKHFGEDIWADPAKLPAS